MTLFQFGTFTLSSGEPSTWKIECDQLADEDWAVIGSLLAARVMPFSTVVGVPRGGMKLAAAMRHYCHEDADRVLFVDDVLTTGGSMERAARIIGAPNYIGAVAFSRNPNPPSWITPLFTIAPEVQPEVTATEVLDAVTGRRPVPEDLEPPIAEQATNDDVLDVLSAFVRAKKETRG